MSSRNIKEQAIKAWENGCRCIDNSFDIEFKKDPALALGFEEWHSLLERLKGSTPAVLNGLVIKECFKSNLSLNSICHECADDLAMEFARQCLGSKEQKEWTSFWTKAEASGTRKTSRFYKPSIMLPSIDIVGGPGSFVSIVQELLSATKSGLSLSFDEYVLYLRKRLRRISSYLDATELRIVTHLMSRSSEDNNSIAVSLNLTPEWVSRKITELRKRKILRRFDRTPFSKVGIRMFNLFIDITDTEENPFKFMEACPFLYSYQQVLTGKWNALYVLCVPDNITSLKLIGDLESLLSKWGLDSSLREIVSSGAADCFDHYSTSKQAWEMPWELLELHLKRIYDGNLAEVIERVDKPTKQTQLRLDDIDMQIINQVRSGNTSVAGIRAALRIGQGKASKKVRRLREEGLIETTWEVHNIGLNESVVVTTSQSEIGEAIAAWSLRLPRAIASFDIGRNLTLTALLPKGGGYGLTRCLVQFANAVDVGILDQKIYGGWGFPIELWDSRKQGWKCPKNAIDDWLNTIR